MNIQDNQFVKQPEYGITDDGQDLCNYSASSADSVSEVARGILSKLDASIQADEPLWSDDPTWWMETPVPEELLAGVCHLACAAIKTAVVVGMIAAVYYVGKELSNVPLPPPPGVGWKPDICSQDNFLGMGLCWTLNWR